MSKNTCFCALLVLICAHRLSERIKSFEIWTEYSSQCGNYLCFLVWVDSIWSSPLKLTKTLNSSWCSWWCSSRSTGGVGGSPKKIFFFFCLKSQKNGFEQKKFFSSTLLGRGWGVQTYEIFQKKFFSKKNFFSIFFFLLKIT